jgi:hypothetical protein
VSFVPCDWLAELMLLNSYWTVKTHQVGKRELRPCDWLAELMLLNSYWTVRTDQVGQSELRPCDWLAELMLLNCGFLLDSSLCRLHSGPV